MSGRSVLLSLSPTGISKWRFCPQAWRYRYEQGLGLRLESGGIAVGTLQHAALEALARGDDPAEGVRQTCADRKWDVAPTADQIAEALSAAPEIWGLVSRLWPGASIEQVEEGLSAPHPEDPTLTITGRPDLILRDRAGRRVLLDYKRRSRLSRTRPTASLTPEDLYGAAHTIRDFQSSIYSLLLAWDGRPVDESFLIKSTARGAEVQILRTTAGPEVLAHTSAALLGLAAQIRAEPSAADRAYPSEGSCFAYGAPCEFSEICAAEVQGRPVDVLRDRLTRRSS